MIDWNAIGLRALRGAIIGAVVGLVATPFIIVPLIYLGLPLFSGVSLMIAEGVIGTGATYGVNEYIRQRGWQP